MRIILKIISLAVSLTVFLAVAPALAAIETRTAASWEVVGGGDVLVSVNIFNDGDETAYNLETTMFFGEPAFYRGALGDNPPGGWVHLEFLVEKGLLLPGSYTAVIETRFEEQTGASHRIYHPLQVSYLPGKLSTPPPPIEVELVDPVFNPRAFWAKTGAIPLTIANRGETPLAARIAAWCPDGFSIRPDTTIVDLDPNAEAPLRLSAALAGASRTSSYYLTIDTENAQSHHSMLVRGVLAVEPEPVYFKIYLLIASAGALLIIVWMTFRRR